MRRTERKKDEPVPRRRADLPERVDELRPVTTDTVLGGEILEDARLCGADLSEQELVEFTAKNCVFEGVSFAGCEMAGAFLQDVRMVRCDLSNSTLRGFQATRVEFIDCRLIGVKATECRWQDVLMENCDGRYVQLNDGRVRSSEFRGSTFVEADFRGTDLEGTVFAQVDLTRADLRHTKLRNIDLCGAEIEGIMVGPEDVRGAIVTAPQAMDLARLLGLVIR